MDSIASISHNLLGKEMRKEKRDSWHGRREPGRWLAAWTSEVFSGRDGVRAEHWWRAEPREGECEQRWWELGEMICSLAKENKLLMSTVSWQVETAASLERHLGKGHDLRGNLSLWSTHPHLYLQAGKEGWEARMKSWSWMQAQWVKVWVLYLNSKGRGQGPELGERAARPAVGPVSFVTAGSSGLLVAQLYLFELRSCCQKSCPWIGAEEKTGEWHTYCATPFMNKLVKSNSTSTSLAFFNEPVSNKWPFNSTKQLL